jgi:uncharacterized protein YfiM (DUF2279 family)
MRKVKQQLRQSCPIRKVQPEAASCGGRSEFRVQSFNASAWLSQSGSQKMEKREKKKNRGDLQSAISPFGDNQFLA